MVNRGITVLLALLLAISFATAQAEQLQELFPEVESVEWSDYNVQDPGAIPTESQPSELPEIDYFYDYSGNGIIADDIGKFQDGSYVMESLKGVNPELISARQTLARVRSFEAYADETTTFIPGFRNERINVELVDLEGNRETFGVVVEEGKKDPITYSETPIEDPTAKGFALSTAVNDILNSDEKMKTYRQAVKNDQIRVKGVGLMNRLKYAMMDFFMEFTGAIYNLFVQKTTIITTTTHWIDEAGNVVKTETSVEKKVENYTETVDTRETVEREQLLTVEDCEDAKKKWEELQADWRKKDCTEEKKKLDQATEDLNDAKIKLDSAKLNHKAAKEAMEAAKEEYVNFFKNHLFHNNVKYEPTPGFDNSWGVPGTDFTIHFNDDGSALLDYINEYEDDFGKLQRAFYDARKKAKEAQEKVEDAQKEYDKAQEDYDKAKKAYEECLKQKAALKEKVTEFEAEWKDCVKTLREQEEIKNGLAPQALREIEATDRTITGIPDANDGKSPCPEADRLRREANDAARDARFEQGTAKSRYNSAQRKFKDGDLDGAKTDLEEAKGAARDAREKAQEAQRLRRQANAAQARCDREAEEEARREKAQEEREKREQEREEEESSQIGTTVREQARTTYHEEPMEVDAKHLKVGLYTELSGQVGRECLDTCDKKLMKLGKTAAGQVFVDMTWELGIGVAKAPIDALSPESLAGQVAQKVTSHLLGAMGASNLGEYAVEAVASEVGGVLFPKMIEDSYLAGKANKLTVNLGKKGIKELLEEEGVQVTKMEYKDGRIWDPCEGWINCKGEATMLYNPHTRYVVTMIKGDCCPGMLIVKYKVNKYGQSEGPVSTRYIR